MSAATKASELPPFYRDPQPLSSEVHAAWRLKETGAEFAADAAYVPIVASEFAEAARCYPIVFAASGNAPIAVLGLERRNLFVSGSDWDADYYIPAYVRRYPFGFIDAGDAFILSIDAGADAVVCEGEEGDPLFAGAEPSEKTRSALAFCEAYHGQSDLTRAFTAALADNDLLIERRADATLPDGRRLGLEGFRIVDREKFQSLDDAVVLDWHRRGWAGLVHFHLASLDRFSVLLARQSRIDAERAE